MADLGLTRTEIRGDELSTSPLDMLRLLEDLAAGQAIDGSTSAEMVHLMSRQRVRNRIPSLLPPEAVAANKTGDWEDAAHDVGIVYAPRATFIVALLSDGIADHLAVYNAMSQAARNLYDLTEKADFPTRPDPVLPTIPLDADGYASAPHLPPPPPPPTAIRSRERQPRVVAAAQVVPTASPAPQQVASITGQATPAPVRTAVAEPTTNRQIQVQPTPSQQTAESSATRPTPPATAAPKVVPTATPKPKKRD